jgi:hypothetical protein
LLDLVRGKTIPVKDDPGWGLFPEFRRHGHRDLRGDEIADLMNGHGSLVGDHTDFSAPKRPSDEVFVIARGPFPQPINSAVLTDPIAALGMIVLKLLWIARCLRLGGGKVPPLAHGELVEPPPGILGVSLRHYGIKVT